MYFERRYASGSQSIPYAGFKRTYASILERTYINNEKGSVIINEKTKAYASDSFRKESFVRAAM